MTAIRHLYVREYAEDKQDKFLDSLFVTLPTDQEVYLTDNRETDRYQLFKLFKKKFNSPINKVQFNFALMKVRGELKAEIPIPPSKLVNHPRPKVRKEQNVYWVAQQGIWAVKFKRDNKTKCLGRFQDFERAVKAAEEFCQNSA